MSNEIICGIERIQFKEEDALPYRSIREAKMLRWKALNTLKIGEATPTWYQTLYPHDHARHPDVAARESFLTSSANLKRVQDKNWVDKDIECRQLKTGQVVYARKDPTTTPASRMGMDDEIGRAMQILESAPVDDPRMKDFMIGMNIRTAESRGLRQ